MSHSQSVCWSPVYLKRCSAALDFGTSSYDVFIDPRNTPPPHTMDLDHNRMPGYIHMNAARSSKKRRPLAFLVVCASQDDALMSFYIGVSVEIGLINVGRQCDLCRAGYKAGEQVIAADA